MKPCNGRASHPGGRVMLLYYLPIISSSISVSQGGVEVGYGLLLADVMPVADRGIL